MSDNASSSSPFPDILAARATKETLEYGLSYAKAIWGEHESNKSTYDERIKTWIENREYAEGLQSIQRYKDRKGISNTSYLNLDYTPINYIATTIDNIVGKLSEINFKVQCNAIDPESKLKFDDYRNQLRADRFLKKISDELEPVTGISLVNKDREIPESDEEEDLHLQMNYKQEESIMMELAFEFVGKNNGSDDMREQIIRDLLTNKIAATHRYYDENRNIRFERVDYLDLITPYSKHDNFKNIPYVGLLKGYTVGELAVMGKFSNKELYEIAKLNAGKNGNAAWSWENTYENVEGTGARPYYNFNIQVLEFYFLAIDNETWEFRTVKKRKYLNKNFDGVKKPDSEVVSKKHKTLYEGKWIIGTDHLINYKRTENVPTEKINGSYCPNAELPIRIIAPNISGMKNKSHVARMRPHEDQINLARLTFQTFLIKAKPPGVAVDIRGLMDAAKGMGESFKPIDILKIYEQTGNLIYSSISEESDVINSKVITELRGGVSDAIHQLIQVHHFERQMINEVIGYNSAVDASSPSANALVGVQKHAIQATNNSLRPIFKAFLKLINATYVDLGLMIQDSLEFNNEAFINAIGAYSTKTIEFGKKLSFVQMGIKIELMPDEDEKLEINEQIKLGQMANPPLLTPSDVIRIRQVMKENVKLASQLLIFLEKKNRDIRMKESIALQQENGKVQIQSAEAAAKSTAETEQMKHQNSISALQTEYDLKSKLSAQEHQQVIEQIVAKNTGTVTVAEVNVEGKEKVQMIANEGKIISQQIANESKEYISENKIEKSAESTNSKGKANK